MKNQPVVIEGKIKLKHFDPAYCGHLDKAETKKQTDELGLRLGRLQPMLYANARHAVLLIFQGMDASGKDGSVRTVLQHVNPAGVETANFKVPSAEELAHDYLWRIHHAVPRRGNIGVFNRSHYESVLAERVLELVPRKIWSKRYQQIVNFERMLVENGVIVLKFNLHISRDDQAAKWRAWLWPVPGGAMHVTQSCEAVSAGGLEHLRELIQKRADAGLWWSGTAAAEGRVA